MKSTVNKKTAIIVIVLFFVVAAISIAFPLLYLRQGFIGVVAKDENSFSLNIEWMNGTDSHSLNLNKDDALKVDFNVEKGSIYLLIQDPEENSIYSGNGSEANHFEVNILEKGIYSLTVRGNHAKGSLLVSKK